MASTSHPSGAALTRDTLRAWAIYLGICALLGSGGFSLLGLWDGQGIADHAMVGAVLGPALGVQWRWSNHRAEKYRSKYDPPGPTLTLASLPLTHQPPAERRYGAPPGTTMLLWSLLLICIPLVIIGSLTQEPAWAWLVIWVVVTVPLGGLLWTVLYTFTEISPDGILLKKPLKSRLVRWSELAEVGWQRDPFADVVVLSTLDGRKVKTVGIAISRTGGGRKRVLRMLADIEQGWAEHLSGPVLKPE
jgi:hypothetical protein